MILPNDKLRKKLRKSQGRSFGQSPGIGASMPAGGFMDVKSILFITGYVFCP